MPSPAMAEADVTIRYGFVSDALEGPLAIGPTWQMTPHEILWRVPGVARFLLQSGREVTVALEDNTPPADVAVFLTGTVLGVLLHQRQHIVLHASAVRINGKAVLFCGRSGAGKSTMAAALVRRGYSLIADDLSAITFEPPSAPAVLPDGRFLKLWHDAIEGLDVAERRRQPVRSRLQKYYVDPAATCSEPLPIGAVYVLRDLRPPCAAGIEQPNVVDAAIELRRCAYRQRLTRSLHQRSTYFRAAAAIADRVGVFHLTRPLDFAALPEVVGWLERHWSTGAIAEARP